MTQALIAVALLISALRPVLPQSNPLTDSTREEWLRAYAKFKPGPRLSAELERLKLREREAFDLWQEGAVPQRRLSIEIERNQIHRHLLLCLAIVAWPRDEVPELVVTQVNTREIRKVFPTGKLPTDPLQPNTIYETEPGGHRRVRYLTLFRWDSKGERFAVFAREVEP